MMQFLVTHGADVNHVDSRMKIPLSFALKLKSPEVIKTLLSLGADPESEILCVREKKKLSAMAASFKD